MPSKSAFVAIVGRPSAGKSTLINTLCGQKVAIVSPIPQTTRNAIRGIVSRPEGQLVFIDTPGRHVSEKKLNKKLLEVTNTAMADSDLILYLIDATRNAGLEEQMILENLNQYTKPLLVAINKIDDPGAMTSQTKTFIMQSMPQLSVEHIHLISALQGTGVEELLHNLFELAPEGVPLYPEEIYTDQDVPFRIAEIIREQAILQLREEIPHCLYVEVADTELRNNGTRLWVRAFIVVERESQKAIVIGKGGSLIKTIRQAAQKELNSIFDWRVDLDLRVKTAKDWRQNDAILRRLIDR